MNYYTQAFKKYATFSGRASRAEYWYFILFNMLIVYASFFACIFLAGFIVSLFNLKGGSALAVFVPLILPYVYSLAIIIPSIALAVRRLHDTGRSGWLYFIAFVPIVGPIALLVFLILKGHPGQNQYGMNPIEDRSNHHNQKIIS